MTSTIIFCVTVLVVGVSTQELVCPESCDGYLKGKAEMDAMMKQMQSALQVRMSAIEDESAVLMKKTKRQGKKVEKLERQIAKMQADEEDDVDGEKLDMGKGSHCERGVIYEGSCFAVIDSTEKQTRESHEKLCNDYGGHLANVYSEEHLMMLNDFLMSEKLTSTSLWLGMTYSMDGGLKMQDGSKASFEQWMMSVFPARHWLWTAVLFRVDNMKTNQLMGMIASTVRDNLPKAGFRNITPTSKYKYSICEYDAPDRDD